MDESLVSEDRRFLLRVARQSLEAALGGRPLSVPEGGPGVRAPRGAFVSLHRREDGELRGCVGLIRSELSLAETVARMAVAAATHDGRFPPVVFEELVALNIEVSALGPLRLVRPEEVEVGRHGLLVRLGERQGVLLPQVAIHLGWDRETFLDKTCGKAGLGAGAWQRPEAEILVFTAEVFGEVGEP
jgi:AmmeMemoRadiSam system protein A